MAINQKIEIILSDYILMEATDNYPDTLISTTSILQGNNWYKTHEELHKQGLYMPTLKQFADFLKVLKTGKVFDGQGKRLPSTRLEQIFNKITKVRKPWRAEWLDANFEARGGVKYIDYNHRTINGQLQPQNSEALQSYLGENRAQGIDLEYWIENSTFQGLPPTNTQDGNLYYWKPKTSNDSVAWFIACSDRVVLTCCGGSKGISPSLGVRPCAEKN